jgi:acyl carrier protein
MQAEVFQVVREAWCSALGVPDVVNGTDFFAAGGTSVSAIQMMEEVERRLQIEFPLDILFFESHFDSVLRECDARYASAARPQS